MRRGKSPGRHLQDLVFLLLFSYSYDFAMVIWIMQLRDIGEDKEMHPKVDPSGSNPPKHPGGKKD